MSSFSLSLTKPVSLKSLPTTSAVRSCNKFNKKVNTSICKLGKKIESPHKIENNKNLNFSKWYS